jgi:hypothetical protein
MVGTLAVKKTAKEAWDAVKIMRVGVDRVREASAQRLRKEFNAIEFNADETLDKFNMRIMGIVNSLRTLGDTLQEVDIMRKILEVGPERYSQIACSIETLLDLNVVSVEELIGRLRCSETRRTMTTLHCSSRRQSERRAGDSANKAKAPALAAPRTRREGEAAEPRPRWRPTGLWWRTRYVQGEVLEL